MPHEIFSAGANQMVLFFWTRYPAISPPRRTVCFNGACTCGTNRRAAEPTWTEKTNTDDDDALARGLITSLRQRQLFAVFKLQSSGLDGAFKAQVGGGERAASRKRFQFSEEKKKPDVLKMEYCIFLPPKKIASALMNWIMGCIKLQ